ncbi:uroporphyrinogen-III C-methyltransferase [Paraferrimonas sedimenticola]|uniref:Uroporphyrinogen III methylase n=1 Tax=Paraferrimonas sedimenticola TaxID=375674 RepID=A0AA37VZ75_9GAMM|nr:uroporphyrinogen-III C-methyltransferase [Paraferrimonas sedimenticola]GLP97481.1 uroporphyrinogen III methylase [Paraferrimonas sedimenticola]
MSDNKPKGTSDNSPDQSKQAQSPKAPAESNSNTASSDPVVPSKTPDPKAKPAAADKADNKAKSAPAKATTAKSETATKPASKSDKTKTTAPSPDKTQQQPAKASNALAWLCLVLIVALGAGGAWLFTQFQTLQQQQAQLNGSIDQQLSSLLEQKLQQPLSQVQSLHSQQQALTEHAQTHSDSLQALSDDQQELQIKLNQLADRNPNHWLAAEADYLVRIAGRKLWLEQDIASAVALLESADDRVKSMRNPSLMQLRRALAQDIQTLKRIEQVDISGTALIIDTLVAELDQLPVNFVELPAIEDDAESEPVSKDAAEWKQNFSRAWSSVVDQLFTIRRRGADTEALLAPEQEWFLKENIRNRLLRAQVALYRGEQANYVTAIETAATWVNRYFDLESATTQQALATLDALKQVRFKRDYPQTFKSSRLLEQLVNFGELVESEAKP